MILEGLLGPTLSPKNLATVLTWVHFRGALVLALLCAGNLFCLACPFMLVRNFMRRWIHAALHTGRGACATSGSRRALRAGALHCTSCSASGLLRGSPRGSSSATFSPSWSSTASSRTPPSANMSAPSASSISSRPRLRRLKSPSAITKSARLAEPRTASAAAARLHRPRRVCSAAANSRSFSRPRSATWTALSASIASTPARTTTWESSAACPPAN